MSKVEVSIIIVHYQAQNELFACLDSIKTAGLKASYETVVVDNDEKKTIEGELKRKFPGVKYLKADGNVGFGAGNNLGARQARGKFLFFLNPDTEVLPQTIDKLTEFLQKNKKATMVAPLLLDPQNKPYPLQGTGELTPLSGMVALSFLNKLFPQNPISRKYWLADWNKKNLREVAVVPGTAFLIKKSIFDKIGGFDEKFFLYFEETDLCKRVKELGWNVFIEPKARVIHHWGVSAKKLPPDLNKKFFTKSRMAYFRKHYGLFWTLAVEAFARFSKEFAALLAIFLLGAFLRFFRLEENFVFGAEIGENLLDIKNDFEQKTIPLLGPNTSHPWLSLGPLSYWLFGPILAFSGFNPVSYDYFQAFASALIIPLNFLVIKKLFEERTALISSFLIAFSPLFLRFAKGAVHFSLIPLFLYPFLLFLFRVFQGEKKFLFWAAFFFGLLVNLHFMVVILGPFILVVLLYKRVKFEMGEVLKISAGFVLPLTPIFLNEVLASEKMLVKFWAWVPYRVAGFLGLIPKNTVSGKVIADNVTALGQFFQSSFTPGKEAILGLVITAFAGLYLVLRLRRLMREKAVYFGLIFILIWFTASYLALFIHGSPPPHYFSPLLPLPILIFSLALASFWDNQRGRLLVAGFISLLVIVNLRFFFSGDWFFRQQVRATVEPPFVPYRLQLALAERIIGDAKGEPFNLKRVGHFDYYEDYFAQNYGYLLWWMGNEPKYYPTQLTYTIFEDEERLPVNLEGKKMRVSNLVVVKEER